VHAAVVGIKGRAGFRRTTQKFRYQMVARGKVVNAMLDAVIGQDASV
jgi:hypothetical protein